ncbi:MAG: alpha/beta hydrolase [Lachnospiraceae bacterium]|nr:alpha/beta hydrolase [Lachnospiraceae bacterium]
MYIQLNNQVLFYEKTGESGPEVLLLHGNGETHEIFDELTQKLSIDHQVITMDSRGHGLSASPGELHYTDMASDVINLISELEMDKPLIVGFSDGAIVAMIAAIQKPDIASGLILCGGNLTPKGLKRKALHEIKKEHKKHPSALTALMLNEPNISEDSLARIPVNTLVLAGQHDMIREKETKLIAACIPKGRYEILPGEDHGSYVEHSTKLLPYIYRFTK